MTSNRVEVGELPAERHSVDAAIMLRLAQREKRAMTELYDRYSGMVYGLALRITGSPTDASEVVQEVYAQVWRQAELYEPLRSSVASWLCMIARTRALDLTRARARRPSLLAEDPALESPAESSDAVQPSPEQAFLGSEAASRLKQAFVHLSEPERRMLQLAYYEDMSHSEIAASTGLPLGTVKTHISRAVKKLKGLLETSGGQEVART